MAGEDSFFQVRLHLEQGDEAGAQRVFERFARQLIAQARSRLSNRLKQKVDPEDIVQSAFKSFFKGQAAGQFDLENWDSLWGLLLQITQRKCNRWAEHYGTQRRNIGAEVTTSPTDQSGPGWDAPGREPMPLEAAVLNETLDGLKAELDPVEWEILSLRLQEYTVPEIAEMISRSERTVGRLLQRVRTHLLEQFAE